MQPAFKQFGSGPEYIDTFKQPTPDLGVGVNFDWGLVEGFRSGFGVQLTTYITDKNRDALALLRNEAPVPKAEFETKYSLEGRLQWYDGMSYGTAEDMFARTVGSDFRQRQMSKRHFVAGLSGGLVGGFLDPANLVVSLAVPEAMAFNFAKVSTAARASTAARVSQNALNAGVSGLRDAMLTEIPNAIISQENGQPYTYTDFLFNMGTSAVAGAGIRAGITSVRPELDQLMARAVIAKKMNGADSVDLHDLAKNAQTIDPATRELSEVARSANEATSAQVRGEGGDDVAHMAFGDAPEGWFRDRAGRPDVTPVTPATRQAGITRQKAVTAAILNDPSTRAVAQSSDEIFMKEAWQTLFGVDVRFIDPRIADKFGVYGFIQKSDPNSIFVRAGVFGDGADPRSMAYIAGHELGHSIRFRNQKMWRGMVDAMMKTDDPALVQAYEGLVSRMNGNAAWQSMRIEGKLDEVFANVFGQAMLSRQFWTNLNAAMPREAGLLRGAIAATMDKFSRMAGLGVNKLKDNKVAGPLYAQLGRMITAADEAGIRLSERTGLDPKYAGLEKFYAPIKESGRQRLNKLSRYFNAEQHKKIVAIDEVVDELVTSDAGVYKDLSNTGRFAVTVENRRIPEGMSPEYYAFRVVIQQLLGQKDPKMVKLGQDYLNGRLGGAGALQDKRVPFIAVSRNADGTYNFAILKNDDFPKWYQSADDLFPSEEVIMKQQFLSEHFYKVNDAMMKFLGASEETESRRFKNLVQGNEYFQKYFNSLGEDDRLLLVGNEMELDAFWGGYREFLVDAMNREMNSLDDIDLKAAQKLFAEQRKEGKPFNLKDHPASRWSDPDRISRMAQVFDDIDRLDAVIKAVDNGEAKEFVSAHKTFVKEWKDFLDKEVSKSWQRKVQDENSKAMGYPPTDQRSPMFIGPRMDVAALRARMLAEIEQERIRLEDNLRSEIEASLAMMDPEGPTADMHQTLTAALKDLDRATGPIAEKLDAEAKTYVQDSGLFPEFERTSLFDKSTSDTLDEAMGLDGEVPERSRNSLDQEQMDESRPGDYEVGDDEPWMATHDTPEEALNKLRGKLAEQDRSATFTAQRVREHLKQLTKEYSTFVHDATTAHQALVKTRLEELGVPDVTKKDFELKPLAEGEKPLTKRQLALVESLMQVKDRMNKSAKVLDGYLEGRVPPEEFARWADLASTWKYHKNTTTSLEVAKNTVYADIRAKGLSEMVGILNRERSIFTFRNLAQKGINWVYSKLDGHRRVDVAFGAGDSIARRVQARQDELIPMFHTVLHQTGLMEAWAKDALLPPDQRIVPQVMAAMLNDPRVTDPNIKLLAETVRDLNTVTMGMLNAAGARIRPLDNYLFATSHNAVKIKARGFEAWKDFVAARLDWARTEKIAGVGRSEAAHEAYLKDVFRQLTDAEELVPQNLDEIIRLGNTAETASRRRTLHWQGTSAYDYDMEFGSGNPGGHIVAGWALDVHKAVMMEEFGPQPRDTFTEIMKDVRLAKDPSAKFDPSKIVSSSGRVAKDLVLDLIGYEKAKRVQSTFDHLIGDLNHPANITTAEKGKTVRAVAFAATGFTSGIASMTDQGNILSTIKWVGGRQGFARNAAYFEALKRHALTEEGRAFMVANGAADQAFITAYTKATAGGIYGLSGAAADTVFKLSGLEFSTRVSQMAMHDVLQQILGDIRVKGLSVEEKVLFKNWLDHYGITETEFDLMAASAAEIPGMPGMRVAPELITNTALRRKLQVALNETVSYGVLEPSESTKAHLTFMTKAGTTRGEAVRCISQYKSYPLTVMTKVLSRFDNGYAGWSSPTTERLVWAGMMMGLATGVLATKDILRGNDPFNPLDSDQWTVGNLHRWLVQAGAGPVAAIDQFGSIQGALGPSFGAAYGLGEAAVTGNGYAFTNRVIGATPFVSAPPVAEMTKAIVAEMSDSYDIKRRQVLAWQLAETGRGRIWDNN